MKIVVVLVIFCLLICARSNELGSSNIACVIVPRAMNGPKSWGILSVLAFAAVWLGNLGLTGLPVALMMGVMSTAAMFGGPGVAGDTRP